MSRLDELIKELCPNGVEYRSFYDIAEYIRGVSYGKTMEVNDGGDGYKLLRANNINLSTNTLNLEDVKTISFEVKVKPNQMLKKDYILICAGSGSKEHIGKVAYISNDMDYTFGGFMGVIKSNSQVNPHYMFHVLRSPIFKSHLLSQSSANSSTINNINNDTWRNFEIPLPPLPVQEEIVRILDTFTELEAKLEAELEARKKQYEYYFSKTINLFNSPKVKLETIGKVKMCKRIMKSQTSAEGDIPFYKIGTFGKEADAFMERDVYEEYLDKYPHPSKGDILISCSGTIGRTVKYDGEPAYFQDSNIVWLEHDGTKVSNEYLWFAYKTKPWIISEGGTISRLYNDGILKAEIPLPTLEQQKHIVHILSKFDTLCNDLTQGLPAEIEARKKQYEYYRDKLLSFKRKEA